MRHTQVEFTNAMVLNQLRVGQCAQITGYLQGDVPLLQRLLAMGLIRGTQVQVLRFAPLGDPMEISVRGYQLSVRRHEAGMFKINLLS